MDLVKACCEANKDVESETCEGYNRRRKAAEKAANVDKTKTRYDVSMFNEGYNKRRKAAEKAANIDRTKTRYDVSMFNEGYNRQR